MMKPIIASAIIAASLTLSTAPALALDAQQSISDQQAETEILSSGSMWTKGAYKVEGAFRFEQRGDDTYLVVERDFTTKNGPDLKFVLSPLAHDTVRSKTALSGGLIIGLLKSNTGTQEFRLPSGTDLSKYRSLLVHCEQYTKLWGAAPINEGQLLAHGNDWTKKTKKITGSWEIAKTQSGIVIRLGEDFKTSNAPDLKLFLSTKPIARTNNDNATAASTFIAELRSEKGASEYRLEAVENLDQFKALIIHCEQYTKLWGGADL